jgi:molybdate transport repressor ModE-like protein
MTGEPIDRKRRVPAPVAAPMPAAVYRIDRLRLRHLRLLQLVERHGSLGSAARALGVSQPAVTLLLRELEAVFASRLVERGPRGARITVAGQHALERIAIALASVERAMEAAQAPAAEPIVRLGCVQVAGVNLLPTALARMEKRGATGHLQIREGRTQDLVAALCAGQLDCVIGWMDEAIAERLPAGQVDVAPLGYGAMHVVAGRTHPLARRRAVTVPELADWPWIVPPPESRTHAAFRRLFLGASVMPSVTIECASLHSTLHLITRTRLLTVTPDAAADAYARRGMIVTLKGTGLDLGRNRLALMTRREVLALPSVVRLRGALLAAAP